MTPPLESRRNCLGSIYRMLSDRGELPAGTIIIRAISKAIVEAVTSRSMPEKSIRSKYRFPLFSFFAAKYEQFAKRASRNDPYTVVELSTGRWVKNARIRRIQNKNQRRYKKKKKIKKYGRGNEESQLDVSN